MRCINVPVIRWNRRLGFRQIAHVFVWFACLTTLVFADRSAAAIKYGDVLVTQFSGGIAQFDANGTPAPMMIASGTRDWRIGAAFTPDGLFVTTRRTAFTTDCGVEIYDRTGALVRSFATPETGLAGDVSVFADGTIAVVSQAGAVKYYDPTGTYLSSLAVPSGGGPALFGSMIAPDDSLWLCDGRGKIFHYRQDGTLLNDFVVGNTPTDIAWDPSDGSLWLAKAFNHFLYHYSTAGVQLGSFALNLGVSNPRGVALGLDGSIFVSDYNTNLLTRYSRSGELLQTITAPTDASELIAIALPEPATMAPLVFATLALLRRKRQ